MYWKILLNQVYYLCKWIVCVSKKFWLTQIIFLEKNKFNKLGCKDLIKLRIIQIA